MWSNKYIGIPFKDGGRDSNGVDCWGLVRLVYKNEFNINLPSFSNEYSTTSDVERLEELINQYREGWTETKEPKEGSIVLFRMMGRGTHVGVLVNTTQFLHVNEDSTSTIENISSHRWKDRILGFYNYSAEKYAILNAVPHPLRTQSYNLPIPAGTTLQEVSTWLFDKWKVSTKLVEKIIIIVNGQVVEQDRWKTFVLQDTDKVEYRALARGGSAKRIFSFIAIIVISIYAPQIAYAISQGSFAGFGTAAFATSATAFSQTVVGAVMTAGVSIAGAALVNAIAPIRPPTPNQTDPGSAEAQLMATGNQNRATPYEAIPIVLGKMRITPPIGAINFVSFQNDRDTYLSSLLVWGYGPLSLIPNTLRIGEIDISNYVVDKIQHHNFNGIANNLSNLNDIYGQDIAQVYKNQELPNDTHPFAGSVPSPSRIEASVPSLGSTQEPYTSIQIAVHFPQGLRKILASGKDAGKSFALTDSNGGSYPVQVKFEWNTGSGWQPITTIPGADASGVVEFGSEQKKDAFTKTFELQLPAGTGRNSIQIGLTRLTGAWSDAPSEGTPEWNSFVAGSGACYVSTIATDSYSGGSYYEDILDTSKTTRAACEATLGGKWIQSDSSNIKRAKDWRFSHQVNLLSLTARRVAAPIKDPANSQLTKTALRLKSSQELNGQLEGINAIVQAYGYDWTGGAIWGTVNKPAWQLASINNPASLFIHVLLSAANPRRILWSEIENRVDLVRLQYWHYYCANKGFTYNAVIGGQRSLLDILRDICAAGRASPTLMDGKWTIVIDEPKTNIVQHFSQHNSWGFESTRALAKLPDGLRVTYFDEDEDYKQSEIIVYNAGKNENNSEIFEAIELPGVTKKSLVIDHAKWHMAQAILRREAYTINTDIEYIICNRGDRVTVTHEVPMWGTGSGRIKARLDANTYVADEALLINPAKQYQVRVRSNSYPLENTIANIKTNFTLSNISRNNNIVTITTTDTAHPFSINDILVISGVSDSSLNTTNAVVTEIGSNWFKYKNVGADATSSAGNITLTNGLYQKFALTGAGIGVKSGTSVHLADAGDLFLFGELNKVSNDLIVISIEPNSSKTARISLVDYGVTNSYNIFTDYLTLTSVNTFETNITLPGSLTGFKLTDKPVITSIISDDTVALLLSEGIYSYRIQVNYANFSITGEVFSTAQTSITGLPNNVAEVECQYDLATAPTGNEKSIRVKYDANSIYINDAEVGKTYRIRLRYISSNGSQGPWTAYQNHTVTGKDTNYGEVDAILVKRVGKLLELTPVMTPMPNDFREFEIRVYKDSGYGDFWNTIPATTPTGTDLTSGVVKVIRTTGPTTVDLTTFDRPRISQAGVQYRIACRAIDRAGNYTDNSALGYILIQNIQPHAPVTGVPPQANYKLTPGVGSFSINVDQPIVNGQLRDDVAGIKLWLSTTNGFTPSSSTLRVNSQGLQATITDLPVEVVHYLKYAIVSTIDPNDPSDGSITLSNQIPVLPKWSLDGVDTTPPPIPGTVTVSPDNSGKIVVSPVISNVLVSIEDPNEIAYNNPTYADGSTSKLYTTQISTTHKQTVIFGRALGDTEDATTVTFSSVAGKPLGFFEGLVGSFPAEPGTRYKLWFKYQTKADVLSVNPSNSVVIETGQDVKKLLHILSGKISEGQLYQSLGKRIDKVDRGEAPVAVEVEQLKDQWSVRIDNGGHISGFGLSSTRPYPGATPQSEFGIRADTFFIAPPAEVNATAPTGDNFMGRIWVDTSTPIEGIVSGVSAWHKVYKPDIHNAKVWPNISQLQVWELKTDEEISRMPAPAPLGLGITPVNRGIWSVEEAYAVNDYVTLDTQDSQNHRDYYICKIAYSPVTFTLTTKLHPDFSTDSTKVGFFTGISPAINETIYVNGVETGIPRIGPSYNSNGTFYYVISGGSPFQLSKSAGGNPIINNTKATVKYWKATAGGGGSWVTNSNLITYPFIVKTTSEVIDGVTVPAGVYIDQAYIANATITTAKIANAAIETAKIKDLSVVNAKISNLDATKITAGFIDAARIQAGTITADKLQVGLIIQSTDGKFVIDFGNKFIKIEV
jgi:sulfur carrier protein ThiS